MKKVVDAMIQYQAEFASLSNATKGKKMNNLAHEAQAMIESGISPDSLVHVIVFPDGDTMLSSPLPHDADLSGHVARYYPLWSFCHER